MNKLQGETGEEKEVQYLQVSVLWEEPAVSS